MPQTLDNQGNAIISEIKGKMITISLKLVDENKMRNVGVVDTESRTLRITRQRGKHLFKKNKSYGFNHFIIKNAKTFDKVLLMDDLQTWLIPKQFIVDNGTVLNFQQEGFELQIFVPIEKFKPFEHTFF